MIIEKMSGELFWGGRVRDALSMPYAAGFSADLSDPMGNQVSYLLLSNRGRVIWSDKPFAFAVSDEAIKIKGTGVVHSRIVGQTLREASLFAQKNIYPEHSVMPPKAFFEAPQFNTWIELIYNQNQKDIIAYAEAIDREGYPKGVLMIDDNWQETYGVWKFHEGRFPDPKGMMNRLHELGFKVILWVVPFVSADTLTFRSMVRENPELFVRTRDGDPAMIKWWNGFSAVLDLSHPEAVKWFKGELTRLQQDYQVDGFKFDAGGPDFYAEDLVYHDPECWGMRQTQLFCELAAEYPYNELRETVNQPHLPCAERLCDKSPTWEDNGLDTLTPHSVMQSLLGYQYICPDMIGGGSYTYFMYPEGEIDQELFVRSAQCSALLPMMQFSAAPWRFLSPENAKLCREAALLHTRFAPYIIKLVEDSRVTHEPVLRSLEYMWPNEGYAAVRDEYMLGDRYLVAPVVQKGCRFRSVTLPEGRWKADDGRIYEGNGVVVIETPLNRLPYFEKI